MIESVNNLIILMNYNERANIKHIIDNFEKKVKQDINTYICKSGLTDYKMNDYDYIILYVLWRTVNISNCIEEILIIMYSYYKLEDFYFSANKFKTKNVVKLLNNKNVTSLLNILIK